MRTSRARRRSTSWWKGDSTRWAGGDVVSATAPRSAAPAVAEPHGPRSRGRTVRCVPTWYAADGRARRVAPRSSIGRCPAVGVSTARTPAGNARTGRAVREPSRRSTVAGTRGTRMRCASRATSARGRSTGAVASSRCAGRSRTGRIPPRSATPGSSTTGSSRVGRAAASCGCTAAHQRPSPVRGRRAE
jgi:hypothetical protein